MCGYVYAYFQKTDTQANLKIVFLNTNIDNITFYLTYLQSSFAVTKTENNMQKTKQVIQRALPLSDKYEIVETYYNSNSKELGETDYCQCENCGKLIANIAVVRNLTTGAKYSIGMDCAKTLTGVRDTYSVIQHENCFNQAKQARAKFLKHIKKCKEANVAYTFKAEHHTDTKNFYKEIGGGCLSLRTEPFNPRLGYWEQYHSAFWAKYVLPMVKDLLTVQPTENAK